MYRFFFVILCIVFLNDALSQETTRMLEEVKVEEERTIGSDSYSTVNEWVVPKGVTEQMENGSLSDLIGRLTPVFVKEAGNGMMSTISLRGASASHTNVNWEGVRINSKTMGQVDFNQLPVFFFDNVVVAPGASSAVYGNGSIGGTVALTSQRCFSDTFALQLHSAYGSNNIFFEGMKLLMAEKNLHSHTAMFFRKSDNDFKFEYRGDELRQKNAAFRDFGIVEDLSIRMGERQILSGHLWLTNYDREIQPMMQLNDDSSKYEGISNHTSRILVQYANYAPFEWKIKAGWMSDKQTYEEEIIKTTELIGQTSVERKWRISDSLQINAKLGYEMSAVFPNVDAYLENKRELHHSVYLLSNFEFLKRWRLTANLRKTFVTDVNVPFSPSGGVFFDALKKTGHQLTIGAVASRNVNIPTLNDKYWGKRSAHDLRVEKGLNVEANIKYKLRVKRYELDAQSSFYRNDVKDWILWLPRGNVWKPTNVDRVAAKGVDVRVEQNAHLGRVSLSLLVGYACNRTEVEEGFAEMKAFEGKQIAFLPQHSFSATLSGKVAGFQCSFTSKWVGERHASDVFDVLQPYFLLNGVADYEWVFYSKKRAVAFLLDAGVQVNNITGCRYEVMPYRAMPLQNFLVFLKLKLHRMKSGSPFFNSKEEISSD